MNWRHLLIVPVIVAGSFYSPAQDPIDRGEVGKLESGITTYEEVAAWWGQGELVGRLGPKCGSIRSMYVVDGSGLLELSWRGGVVCDWKVLPDVAVNSQAFPPVEPI